MYKHIHKKQLPQIAKDVNRTERALNLFLHRNRHDPRLSDNKNNLLIKLLSKKFKDVACFTPTRSFFTAVRIGQKRYWSLYKGLEIITEEELIRIAAYFEVTLEDVFEIRQTKLFVD